MLIDLTDYETKALEIEIKKLEKAILETEGIIANIEFKKLNHELKLIEMGISEEEVEKHIINLVESSDNPEKELLLIYDEFEEFLAEKKDTVIEDLDKILNYSIISISIANLQIEDYKEEINVLNNELLKLKHKRIELQKKKVDEIATERKYKELLHDE